MRGISLLNFRKGERTMVRKYIEKDEKQNFLEYLLFDYEYDEDTDMLKNIGMPENSVSLICTVVLLILFII